MRMFTGDTKPDLVDTISDPDGNVDLTDATSVRIIGKRGEFVVFDRTPDDIVHKPADADHPFGYSEVTMLWQDGDTDTIGRIEVEVEATWPTDEIQTFRASGGVDIKRDFDQQALIPPPEDYVEAAADLFLFNTLNLHGDAYNLIVALIDTLAGIQVDLEEVARDAAIAAAIATEVTNRNTAIAAQNTRLLLLAARNYEGIITGTISRDTNNAITSAPVVWPDGTPGTFTTDTASALFPGEIDAYHITYGSPVTKTYTQPTVTRNAAGAITNLPAIVVT